MAGDEQFLSWDLADVVAGKPPRDPGWDGPGGLSALYSGEGSINLPMLRAAVKLRAGTAAQVAQAVSDWKELFQFFQKQWMGSELGSRIYGVWHMLAVASVLDWSQKNGNTELAGLAQGWLLHWWCLMKLVEAPDGRLLVVGMRSGGHEPTAGFLEWTYALAMDGPVDRWEAVAKELKLGLRQNWLSLLPHYGLVEPYHILKTEGGIAVWIESNQNGNTTPVAAAVWTPQSLGWLPDNGGNRIRQKFEKIDCRPVDGKLVYDSNFQGHQELALPPGKVLAQITLPLGTADSGGITPDIPDRPPVPPPPPVVGPVVVPPQPDTSPPVAAGRTPKEIAADVLTLAVPKKQVHLLRGLADEIARLPAGRPPAEIAADLATLGISQGQQDLWHRLQAEVRALGQEAAR